eukprot:COSAG01_NODE_41128_length_455_cov_1.328652_1_plen_70_part_01
MLPRRDARAVLVRADVGSATLDIGKILLLLYSCGGLLLHSCGGLLLHNSGKILLYSFRKILLAPFKRGAF